MAEPRCQASFIDSRGVHSCQLPLGHNRYPAMQRAEDALHTSEAGLQWQDGGTGALTDADGGTISHAEVGGDA